MPSTPIRSLRQPSRAAAAVVAAILAPAPLLAQQVEDPLVRRGVVRLEVAPEFSSWSDRFGLRTEDGRLVEETEPLGFDLTRDDMGVAMVPTLAGFESALAEALADPTFRLDLGDVRTSWSHTRSRIPIRLDIGITDWLTISGMVPFVRTNVELGVDVRGDSTTANAGLNPTLADAEPVDLFLESLANDVAAFQATTDALCADLGATAPECLDARALLAEGESLDLSLADLYLSDASFIPLTGTDAGRALTDRVASFRAGLEGYGQAPEVGAPPLSETPLNSATFQDLVGAQAYGVLAAPLVTAPGVWQLGDAEVSVAARLLQSPGLTEGTGPRRGLRYLVGARALYRLGTATVANPNILQEVAGGWGTNAVELSAFGAAYAGRRWGLWAQFRYTLQQSVDLERRVSPPDVVLSPRSSESTVTWTPGNASEIYLAPRFNLTDGVSLTVPYSFLSKSADSYTLPSGETGPPPDAPEGTPPVTVLNEETEARLHRLGVGIVYSTLPGFRRDRSSLPLELRMTYRWAVAGSGGQTPSVSSLLFTFRLYLSFWGQGA